MLNEFKNFIMRGNVLDMAVGIIIGAAFTKIVGSFVDDILMPPIGLLTGGTDFSNLFLNLTSKHYASLSEAKAAGAAINYGVFLNALIQFLIVSFAIFLVIRALNRFMPKLPETAESKTCAYCASSIPAKATRCPLCTSELQLAS